MLLNGWISKGRTPIHPSPFKAPMLRKGCSSPQSSAEDIRTTFWLQTSRQPKWLHRADLPGPLCTHQGYGHSGVEASAADEVDTAANHVSCSECGTVGVGQSPRSRRNAHHHHGNHRNAYPNLWRKREQELEVRYLREQESQSCAHSG